MATPVSKFGKDHWSMLDYVETLCVDGKLGVGTIDPRKVRCNENSHPAKSFSRVAWKQSFSTRLFGYFDFQECVDVDKAVASGLQILGHDDWDCLDDLVSAGFVEIISVANNFVRMTPIGLIASAKLREHKANGGMFAGFVLNELTLSPTAIKKNIRLSKSQIELLKTLGGLNPVSAIGLERDGTYSPYRDQMRTFNVLIKLGLAIWRSAGSDGFEFTGISLTDLGKQYVNEKLKQS